ncbi:MAG: AMP-binding protein [Rhodospirillales bacterium]|nr:AMP-binding protein [Rhodospirillales bacterium]
MSGTEAFLAARDLLLRHRCDYAAAVHEFRWPELDDFNWARDWFDAYLASGEHGDRPALVITGEGAARLSFRELSERSNRLANGLASLGLGQGDRIMLMLGNVAPLWETMLAAMKLGAVVVPATTLLTQADLRERVARARVRAVVCADAERLAAAPDGAIRIGVNGAGGIAYETLLEGPATFVPQRRTVASDPMLLYFTSGTTSRPKLVLHTHRSYPVGHLSTMYWLGLQPGDLHLNVSSPGWAKHAWCCFFAPWNAGAAIFIANQPRFNARDLLERMRDAGVSTFAAPPTVWRMLIQEDLAPYKGSLRELCGAGEPLNPEVIEQVERAWGITIRDGYGQTETTCQIGNSPGQKLKPGSMGRPMPGYRLRILDTEDRDAAEGALCLPLDPPPASLMLGYQDDAGNIEKLEGTIYRTGDVVSRDADGYITYVGRADDVFKASDYRISPFELESVLIEHPAVAEAAVVPAPDALRLAVPKAYVALVPGQSADAATAASIFAHCRARLAPYKRIRRIEFVELPKTISGKIRRVELRQREARLFQEGSAANGEFREEA